MTTATAITHLLNDPSIREGLRHAAPEIVGLERALCNVRVIGLDARDRLLISYEAVAPEALYPHVSDHLMAHGILSAGNIESKAMYNQGQPQEYEQLHLTFRGGIVQAYLRIYNPKYTSGHK